jgi:uncharacterized protein
MEMAYPVANISTDPATRAALLALNNASAQETSLLDAAKFARMIDAARVATIIEPARALLLAFDQASDYDGGHFLWFRERYARFLYIDRVIVSAAHRRDGYGRALYAGLFAEAVRLGHDAVACEVNQQPPNPISDAFHARLGFAEVGTAAVPGSSKIVRYLLRRT